MILAQRDLGRQKSTCAADLDYFGDYFNQEEVMNIQEVRGMRIAFIGFHEFGYAGREQVLGLIKQAKQEVDFRDRLSALGS